MTSQATTLDRRRLLLGAGATAAALAATSLPAEPAEYPMVRVNRLSRELALAMDDWCADLGSIWIAHIYPASSRQYPICYENIDAVCSPILALFREWDRLYQAYSKPDTTDADAARLMDEMRVLEGKIGSLPSSSAADFAAKVIAVSSYGDFMLTPAREEDDAEGIIREAVELVRRAA